MAAPISRPPLNSAALAVLQARPVPTTAANQQAAQQAAARANLPQRERPVPQDGARGGIPTRGQFLDIVA
jgi:hypothetical protein